MQPANPQIFHRTNLTTLKVFLTAGNNLRILLKNMAPTHGKNADDDHPIGSGKPAYRIVYKTLRTVTHPYVVLEWPNFRVSIANGDINRGGLTVPDAIPARNQRHRVIPEHGRIMRIDNSNSYMSCPDLRYTFSGWKENVRALCYVEIIYVPELSKNVSIEELYSVGRSSVADLKALLDLKYGPRLLAMPITEEVGETFDDWHWNRHIHSSKISAETQATFKSINGNEMIKDLQRLLNRRMDFGERMLRRIKLASQWYWMADAEPDQVMRFTYWRLTIEALEMVDTTNIAPVRDRLAELCGNSSNDWVRVVGPLYGVRSVLLHGNSRDVTEQSIKTAEIIARILLHSRLLDEIPADLTDKVRALLPSR